MSARPQRGRSFLPSNSRAVSRSSGDHPGFVTPAVVCERPPVECLSHFLSSCLRACKVPIIIHFAGHLRHSPGPEPLIESADAAVGQTRSACRVLPTSDSHASCDDRDRPFRLPQPDTVDIGLPDRDGIDLARELALPRRSVRP
jgi:hypothetical protein